jgi:hypothetical protein
VDKEAKVRTRMESFDDQLDANGAWMYDKSNGKRAFESEVPMTLIAFMFGIIVGYILTLALYYHGVAWWD